MLAGIRTYSLMVPRSRDKGNTMAMPFCTTRTKLPDHQSVLDLLTMYVAIQRLLINTSQSLSSNVFPGKSIPGAQLKAMANQAMGCNDVLISGYSMRYVWWVRQCTLNRGGCHMNTHTHMNSMNPQVFGG